MTECPNCHSGEDYSADIHYCINCGFVAGRESARTRQGSRKVKEADLDPRDIPKFNEIELLGSVCKSSFYTFVKEFWHTIIPETPVWNWHIEYICDELQILAERVFRGEPREYDLIINIPPGTSKSSVASIMLPAWCWTRMPSCRIIGASYAYSLAMDLSRKCRDVIRSPKYTQLFPYVTIREDQDTKGYFVLETGGDRYAVGVNGAVTGLHAHILLVDDPLDPQQSISEIELRAANTWMSETLPSRKVDKRVTPMILIMQRLHQYDPTGARLERMNDSPVKHICLPAEASPMIMPMGLKSRYKDGLLDPIRMSSSVLRAAFSDIGEYGYAAQFQQTPVPRGGAMFHIDKIHLDSAPPGQFKKIVRYWDKSGLFGRGDFTAGVKMAEDMEGHIWVLDVIRGQWDSSRREKIILTAAILDGRGCQVGLEQECGSGGKESADNTVRNLRGYHVISDRVSPSEGSKANRADPLSSQVNAGNVYIPRNAPWTKTFVGEMEYFPKSKHDDQVDAAAGAFNLLMRARMMVGGLGVVGSRR